MSEFTCLSNLAFCCSKDEFVNNMKIAANEPNLLPILIHLIVCCDVEVSVVVSR